MAWLRSKGESDEKDGRTVGNGIDGGLCLRENLPTGGPAGRDAERPKQDRTGAESATPGRGPGGPGPDHAAPEPPEGDHGGSAPVPRRWLADPPAGRGDAQQD